MKPKQPKLSWQINSSRFKPIPQFVTPAMLKLSPEAAAAGQPAIAIPVGGDPIAETMSHIGHIVRPARYGVFMESQPHGATSPATFSIVWKPGREREAMRHGWRTCWQLVRRGHFSLWQAAGFMLSLWLETVRSRLEWA